MTEITLNSMFGLFLVFCRIGAVFANLPGLGDPRITARAKIILIVFISILVIPHVSEYLPSYPSAPSRLVFYICAELLVGAMLGLGVKIYFNSLQVLGNLVSMESGLGSATIFDPTQRESIAIFTSFLVLMAVATIFASDTHHNFIAGTVESYKKFNIGEMLSLGDTSNLISRIVNDSFILAFKISAPFLVVGIGIIVGSGVLSRLMPTLQVFFVITPIQVLIMFAVLFVVINGIIETVINYMLTVF